MRFDDDYEDNGGGLPVIYMALLVSFFILAVLGIVIYSNKKNNSGNHYKQMMQATIEETEEETVVRDKLYADDLDIWNMYPEHKEESMMESETDYETEEVMPTPSVTPEADEKDKDDENHFQIKLSDGTTEWVEIDKKRTKNTYDFMNLKSVDGKLKYYSGDKVVSFVGVDISRYQKSVDFEQIKNSGIEFVMLRVGSRGYQTGQIALDETFEENIKKASEAGLDIGAYFYSQAINTTEAIEEANMVINALNGYKIKYPVAFVMEPVENDMARIDSVTKDNRAVIAATFLNTVQAAGYKTLLFGDEEWLVKKLDLNNFPTTSIWLSDDSDMPDYPYQFVMWRYTTTGSVVGISGDVNMDICFVDYTAQ